MLRKTIVCIALLVILFVAAPVFALQIIDPGSGIHEVKQASAGVFNSFLIKADGGRFKLGFDADTLVVGGGVMTIEMHDCRTKTLTSCMPYVAVDINNDGIPDTNELDGTSPKRGMKKIELSGYLYIEVTNQPGAAEVPIITISEIQ